MAAGKPVFVFIPGAWHTPDTYDGIRELLMSRGFESHAVTTPSVGAIPPDNKGLHNDIAVTQAFLEKLADEGKQVVLITHSYGGMVGSGAVEGVDYLSRAKEGKKGGVTILVYMSAFVVPKGQSLYDALGGQWLPWMIDNVSGITAHLALALDLTAPKGDGYCHHSQGETVFYADLPPEEQQKRIARLKPQAMPAFKEPATYEPWHHMPTMYLFCRKDEGLFLPIQEAFAKTLGNPATFSCDGAHSPFLSVPDQVLEGLEYAAKVGAEKSGAVSTE